MMPPYERAACFHWDEAKKKKNQRGRLKKSSFSSPANSQCFFMKISWISPWVSRIDWFEGHWFCSTPMAVRLANVSSKTRKKCIFCVFRLFWAYVGQPHDHISWGKPMPFASINSTNPRTDPWEFYEKILRIGGAGKWGFFEAAILNFLSWPFWIFFCLIFVKNPALLYEASFFSALWMVSSESWKRGCPN